MVIREKHDGPFGLIPELRCSIVKRWGIIKMSTTQSVAEHSFNVAVITGKLCDVLGLDGNHKNQLMVEAILHDTDEVYTGDIPTPAKANSSSHCNYIVKLADCIEALIFLRSNCIDSSRVAKWVEKNISAKIETICKTHGINHSDVITIIEGSFI